MGNEQSKDTTAPNGSSEDEEEAVKLDSVHIEKTTRVTTPASEKKKKRKEKKKDWQKKDRRKSTFKRGIPSAQMPRHKKPIPEQPPAVEATIEKEIKVEEPDWETNTEWTGEDPDTQDEETAPVEEKPQIPAERNEEEKDAKEDEEPQLHADHSPSDAELPVDASAFAEQLRRDSYDFSKERALGLVAPDSFFWHREGPVKNRFTNFVPMKGEMKFWLASNDFFSSEDSKMRMSAFVSEVNGPWVKIGKETRSKWFMADDPSLGCLEEEHDVHLQREADKIKKRSKSAIVPKEAFDPLPLQNGPRDKSGWQPGMLFEAVDPDTAGEYGCTYPARFLRYKSENLTRGGLSFSFDKVVFEFLSEEGKEVLCNPHDMRMFPAGFGISHEIMCDPAGTSQDPMYNPKPAPKKESSASKRVAASRRGKAVKKTEQRTPSRRGRPRKAMPATKNSSIDAMEEKQKTPRKARKRKSMGQESDDGEQEQKQARQDIGQLTCDACARPMFLPPTPPDHDEEFVSLNVDMSQFVSFDPPFLDKSLDQHQVVKVTNFMPVREAWKELWRVLLAWVSDDHRIREKMPVLLNEIAIGPVCYFTNYTKSMYEEDRGVQVEEGRRVCIGWRRHDDLSRPPFTKQQFEIRWAECAQLIENILGLNIEDGVKVTLDPTTQVEEAVEGDEPTSTTELSRFHTAELEYSWEVENDQSGSSRRLEDQTLNELIIGQNHSQELLDCSNGNYEEDIDFLTVDVPHQHTLHPFSYPLLQRPLAELVNIPPSVSPYGGAADFLLPSDRPGTMSYGMGENGICSPLYNNEA